MIHALQAAVLAFRLLATSGGVPQSLRSRSESPLRVFHDAGKVYVFDTASKQCRRLSLASNPVVLETALGADGRHLVFTARLPETKSVVAYGVDLSSTDAPHRLTETPGHYGNPGISNDGATAYFSFVPDKAGVPLDHAPMRFAEIAAVPFAGGEPRLLTNNRGCHIAPSGAPKGVLEIHASCSTPARWVELLEGDRVTTSLPVSVDTNEAVVCNHGRDVAYMRMASGQMWLTVQDLKTKHARDLSIGFFQPTLQLQCGQGEDLMILRDHKIEIIQPSGRETVFKVEECAP